ncbi:efflux RND transporter periplasmic adaptor subunit [Lysobacter sp. HDW10]|uniref:efflux RND transporter periplasmic adaptor subunit n=1 Tax=Lysobacter sp. HDW10 TaxID=2714936 RepID=UPI0014075057|nr:efflux RND transporter periplasmic adaptor subunit [Lysobacter sp. HDW10]QIK80540.1 efflux RND transporter periplasmic adaptor subunit [Lysobacter sp. HDW10]
MSTKKPQFRKSRSIPWIPLAVVAAIVLAGLGWWRFQKSADADGGAYRTQAIDRGDIRVSISSTGTLSAISTVTVGSQISGQITEILVDFNDKVRKGDILARIDPSTYEAQIEQGNAQIASASAQLAQAQATYANASKLYERNVALAKQQMISKADVDQTRMAMEQARAQVNAAQAQIRQQTASTRSTRVNLDRTVIRSPVDGVVLTRKIEPGQTVAASMTAPELFTIAEDLSKMKIQLLVDESDIGQVKEGQNVSFTADAFPNRQFKGMVQQVQMSSTTTNNVVTYPVIVTVDNSDGTLLPGLTVNAEIEVSNQPNVLRVANAAFRYKPSDEALAAMEKQQGQGNGGSGQAGGGRGGMSNTEDLARIATSLQLNPTQQAAFDTALEQMKARAEEMRKRFAEQQSAAGAQGQGGSRLFGGAGGGPRSGGQGGGNSAQMAQMRNRMRERFQQQFGEFRATLDQAQQTKWDAAINDMLAAKRAPLYLLVDGKQKRVMVRVGSSDGSYTQVSGNIKEGDLAITGQQATGSATKDEKK